MNNVYDFMVQTYNIIICSLNYNEENKFNFFNFSKLFFVINILTKHNNTHII